MNEQIQQMIFSLNGTVGIHWTHEDKIKFAQLIALECIQVCKNQEYEFWRSPEDREYTPQDCADSIAEHFGVKE